MIEGPLKKNKTEKEYRQTDMLSSSDLRLFNNDCKKFYKEKVLKEPRVEEYNKSTLIGSLVHCLLLDPHEFDNRYLMSTCEAPPTGMVLTFTESLYRHTIASMDEGGNVTADFRNLLDTAYVESGFKITQEAAIKKFNDTGKEYYEQLVAAKKNGLEIVCMEDINIANRIVEIVKNDPFVGGYFQDVEYCEQQIEGFDFYGVKMKAMIDKIIPNHTNKTLQIIDPKIVYDNQNFVREYYLKRQGYIPGLIYYHALKSGILDLGFDYSDYTVEPPIFIAIDSGCYYAPVQYKLSTKRLEEAWDGFEENGREYKGVKQILEDLTWCQANNNWTISKQAFENKGVIEI